MGARSDDLKRNPISMLMVVLSVTLIVLLAALIGWQGQTAQGRRVQVHCDLVGILHADGRITSLRVGAVSVPPRDATKVYACREVMR